MTGQLVVRAAMLLAAPASAYLGWQLWPAAPVPAAICGATAVLCGAVGWSRANGQGK